jgi:hypothetical protein
MGTRFQVDKLNRCDKLSHPLTIEEFLDKSPWNRKDNDCPALLQGTLGVTEFANADVIAQGLSAFNPERAAFHAGGSCC